MRVHYVMLYIGTCGNRSFTIASLKCQVITILLHVLIKIINDIFFLLSPSRRFFYIQNPKENRRFKSLSIKNSRLIRWLTYSNTRDLYSMCGQFPFCLSIGDNPQVVGAKRCVQVLPLQCADQMLLYILYIKHLEKHLRSKKKFPSSRAYLVCQRQSPYILPAFPFLNQRCVLGNFRSRTPDDMRLSAWHCVLNRKVANAKW